MSCKVKTLTKGMLCRNPPDSNHVRDWIFFFSGLVRREVKLSSTGYWDVVGDYPKKWKAFEGIEDFRRRTGSRIKLPRKGKCVECELEI